MNGNPRVPASLDGRSDAWTVFGAGCAQIVLPWKRQEAHHRPISSSMWGILPQYLYPKSQRGKFILYCLLSLALLSLKSLDAITNPQFWAEDGAIFYAQQTVSYWPQLATPYAGYLHVVPRTVAWLSSRIDPLYLPSIYNISAIIIDAACVAYSILELSAIVGVGLAFLSFFLLPTVGDVFGTLTNVQWFLQFALVLCVLRPGGPKYGVAGEATVWAFIIIACLTGPFCLVVMPIFAGLLLLRALDALEIAARWHPIFAKFIEPFDALSERIPRGRMAALVLGSVLQGIVVAISSIRTPDSEFALTPQELITFGLAGRVHPYLKIIASPTTHFHLALIAVFASALVATMVVVWLRPNRISLTMAVLMVIGGFQPILAFFKQHATHTLTSTSHYFYFLGVVSFCAVGLALNQLPRRYRIAASATLLTVLICALLLRPEYLSRAYLTPLNWYCYADRIKRGDEYVIVPLNPNWRAVIPGGARSQIGSH